MENRIYFFSQKAAAAVGVNGAVMLNNIAYWVQYNADHDQNFYDGRYWTYNTKEAFQKQFEFWTYKQVRTILDKLRAGGYIVTGHYSEDWRDRTLWYSLTTKGAELCDLDLQGEQNRAVATAQNGHIGAAKNGHTEQPEKASLQYTQINNIHIKNTDNTRARAREDASPFAGVKSDSLRAALLDFREMRKKIRKPLTERAEELLLMKLEKLAPADPEKQVQILNQSIVNSWQGVFELKAENDLKAGGTGDMLLNGAYTYLDEWRKLDERKEDGKSGNQF